MKFEDIRVAVARRLRFGSDERARIEAGYAPKTGEFSVRLDMEGDWETPGFWRRLFDALIK